MWNPKFSDIFRKPLKLGKMVSFDAWLECTYWGGVVTAGSRVVQVRLVAVTRPREELYSP